MLMCAAAQAGMRFCSMLVGGNASGGGVPVEHAIVLACALRDHLLACARCPAGQAGQAGQAKQPKKRKQKGTPAPQSQAQACTSLPLSTYSVLACGQNKSSLHAVP